MIDIVWKPQVSERIKIFISLLQFIVVVSRSIQVIFKRKES